MVCSGGRIFHWDLIKSSRMESAKNCRAVRDHERARDTHLGLHARCLLQDLVAARPGQLMLLEVCEHVGRILLLLGQVSRDHVDTCARTMGLGDVYIIITSVSSTARSSGA